MTFKAFTGKDFTTMLLPKIGALLLTILCCQIVTGATVNQEKERLTTLQQDFVKQEQNLLAIEAELKTLPEQISKAENAVAKAEAELKTEQGQFDKVKSEHAASPTESTERQLRLAEIKTGLATTKVRSEIRDLEKLQNKQKELAGSIGTTKASIASNRTQIQRQEKRVADTIELARQQEIEASKARTAPPKPAPKIAAIQPVIELPIQEVIKVEETDNIGSESSDSTSPITLSKSEFEEFQFAKEKFTAATNLAAETDAKDQAAFTDLKLSGSSISDAPFVYLGNHQYRADAALASGRHDFRVEGLRFRVDVPDSSALQNYVFLMDAQDRNQLRVSYFRKSLLSYIGMNIVIAPDQNTAKPVEKTVAINSVAIPQPDFEAIQNAKRRMANTESLASLALDNERPNFSRLELINDAIDDVWFTYLGNQQYRADVALPSGKHTIGIDRYRLRIEVPSIKGSIEYVFLVDARDKDQLKASYFLKDLLTYDDKDIATAQ